MNEDIDNRRGYALNEVHAHVAQAGVDFSLLCNVESRFVRARAALLRELSRALSGLELGVNEANVLMAIGKGVAGSPTGLSEVVGVDSACMSRLLDRLEKRSLLQRSRSREDRRVVKVSLTEGGTRMYISLDQITPSLLNERFVRLSRAELLELQCLLGKLIGD
ncbi:MarR family winged helix-turn-helix transcriptional regulator [Trinickia violacea]|nr:MarR family transcriptional regulator [Trinickia violacea]